MELQELKELIEKIRQTVSKNLVVIPNYDNMETIMSRPPHQMMLYYRNDTGYLEITSSSGCHHSKMFFHGYVVPDDVEIKSFQSDRIEVNEMIDFEWPGHSTLHNAALVREINNMIKYFEKKNGE